MATGCLYRFGPFAYGLICKPVDLQSNLCSAASQGNEENWLFKEGGC